jgi:small subunit ribosomal protein S21
MLIIDARDSDSIDKALRKYKKKYEKAGIIKELRKRQQFTKPSVLNREKRIKAAYSVKIRREQGLD